MSRSRSIFGAVAVVLGASACTAIVGVEDVRFEDGGAAADASGEAAPQDATSETAGDAPSDVTVDSASDVRSDGSSCAAPGTTCAANVPAPWSGPVAFFAGSSVPSSCTGDYGVMALSGHTGPGGAPVTCNACACGPASGGSCTTEVVSFFNGGCATTCGNGLDLSGCAAIDTLPGCPNPFANGYTSLWINSCYGGTGSCTPSGGSVANTPPVTWSTTFLACSLDTPATTTCPGGRCVPTPPSGPDVALCIYQSGSGVTCPNTYPNHTERTFEQANDARACSACSCIYQGTCNCSLLETDSSCSTNLGMVTGAQTCTAANTGATYLRSLATLTSDYCAPSGGQPTGMVTAAMPQVWTFCCAN